MSVLADYLKWGEVLNREITDSVAQYSCAFTLLAATMVDH